MIFVTKNQAGFSLVSTIIAVAIMGILATVFASMLSMQSKEMKALRQKLASGNLNQLFLRVLQNSKNCSCHLNAAINTAAPGPLNINTTTVGSHDINLQTFRSGCDFSSSNNIIVQAGQEIVGGAGLKVNSVRVTDIHSTGTTNEYSGTLTIDYKNQNLARGLLPIRIDLVFTVDPTSGSAAARPIKACAGEDVTVACANLGGTIINGKCIPKGSLYDCYKKNVSLRESSPADSTTSTMSCDGPSGDGHGPASPMYKLISMHCASDTGLRENIWGSDAGECISYDGSILTNPISGVAKFLCCKLEPL